MTLRNISLSSLAVLSLVFPSCSKKAKKEAPRDETAAGTPAKTDQSPAEQASTTPTSAKKGQFVLQWKDKSMKEHLSPEGGLEELVSLLNRAIALPSDVTVEFSGCGEANAFYDRESKKIVMCSEWYDYLFESFAESLDSEEEIDEAATGVFLFTFFHELGHALVDVLEIPVTGREEDAVDQLATLTLINLGEFGVQATIDSAEAFAMLGEEREELAFWDEHSFGEQRYYDILCLVYGSNPDEHRILVEDQVLPKERSALCEEDFPKVSKAWEALLAPHSAP